MAFIRSVDAIIDSCYAILRRHMDKLVESSEKFDLRHHITYCIVDSLSELDIGQPFDNQVAEDSSRIPAVWETLRGACVSGQVSWAAVIQRCQILRTSARHAND